MSALPQKGETVYITINKILASAVVTNVSCVTLADALNDKSLSFGAAMIEARVDYRPFHVNGAKLYKRTEGNFHISYSDAEAAWRETLPPPTAPRPGIKARHTWRCSRPSRLERYGFD